MSFDLPAKKIGTRIAAEGVHLFAEKQHDLPGLVDSSRKSS